jgi:ketosteroid isomerase-like protein
MTSLNSKLRIASGPRIRSAPGGAAMVALGALGALGAVACGAPPSTAPAAPAAAPADGELSAALTPLAWWQGAWTAVDGKSEEHWLAVGGALYGVSLDDGGGFEVLVVDDGQGRGKADGQLRLFAMPGGAPEVVFALREHGRHAVTFGNDQHDFPKQVRYGRSGDFLEAEISGAGRRVPFRFARSGAVPAPELEAADLAFSDDVQRRGGAAWMDAFEPDGWTVDGDRKLSGDALRATMTPFLEAVALSWAPVASGRRGDLGFTVGKASFTRRADGSGWRGSYVTLWRRQPDGRWKVRFDTGRPIHE